MPRAILGIETSCDETSASVLTTGENGPQLASLVIYSQDVHRLFGGVVPELASRAHLRKIGPVVEQALRDAAVEMADIDSIAVTAGPGLIGALLIGVCYAKGLAASTGNKLIGVHHLEGHLFAPLLHDPSWRPPFVGLVVSGGHTILLDVPAWGCYKTLGTTRDDAAGEAFDKVAKMLNLGYPGGPVIERVAREGADTFGFPRPLLGSGFDFSFSGLKTAVLYAVQGRDSVEADIPDIACSFQTAVFDVLVDKVLAAIERTGYPTVVLGGGVACSKTLTAHMETALGSRASLKVAPPRLNADNAAMIARAGWYHLERGTQSDLYLDPQAAMTWPGLVDEPTNPRTAQHQ